jgi:aspartate 1-decarboxylase
MVTGADLSYVGSITIDDNWMLKAGLVEFEKICTEYQQR